MATAGELGPASRAALSSEPFFDLTRTHDGGCAGLRPESDRGSGRHDRSPILVNGYRTVNDSFWVVADESPAYTSIRPLSTTNRPSLS